MRHSGAKLYTAFPNWLLNCRGIVGITHMLSLTSTKIHADTDTPENREQAMYDHIERRPMDISGSSD